MVSDVGKVFSMVNGKPVEDENGEQIVAQVQMTAGELIDSRSGEWGDVDAKAFKFVKWRNGGKWTKGFWFLGSGTVYVAAGAGLVKLASKLYDKFGPKSVDVIDEFGDDEDEEFEAGQPAEEVAVEDAAQVTEVVEEVAQPVEEASVETTQEEAVQETASEQAVNEETSEEETA